MPPNEDKLKVEALPTGGIDATGGAHGTAGLRDIQNAVPVNGALVPVRKFTQLSTLATTTPVTAAYAHIYQENFDLQILYPVLVGPPLVFPDPSAGHLFIVPYVDPGETVPNEVRADAVGEGAQDASTYLSYGYSSDPTENRVVYSMSDGTLPVTKTGWRVIFLWRIIGGSSADIVVNVNEFGLLRATRTLAGVAIDDDWKEEIISLTTPEATSFTGNPGTPWNLSIAGAVSPLGTSADEQTQRPTSATTTGGQWARETGGIANLHLSLDASDATYVQSPPLAPGAAPAKISLPIVVDDPMFLHSAAVTARAASTNDNVEYYAEVVRSLPVSVVEDTSATVAPTASYGDATASVSMTGDGNYSEFVVNVYASSVAVGTTESTAAGIGVVLATGWTDQAGLAADLLAPIVDTDDATYIQCSGLNESCQVQFATVTPTPAHSVLTYIIRASGSGTVRVDFQIGSVIKVSESFIATASIVDYTITIPPNLVKGLTGGWASFHVKIQNQFGANLRIYKVHQAWPAPQQLRLSDVKLVCAQQSIMQVAALRMEVPGSDLVFGDKVTFFASTNADLHVEEDGAWTEISKTTAAYAPYEPHSPVHDFASFGPHIVAAQSGFDLQWREDNAGDFKDLVTSTLVPQPRLIAVCRQHLFAAGWANTGYGPDYVGWCAQGDIADWDASFVTRAGGILLRTTPGGVIGLVGGDSSLLAFKWNSIHRFDWTSGRTVFEQEPVSVGIGTPYRKSIVRHGQSIFFYNDAGFWIMDDMFTPPRRLFGMERIITDELPQVRRPGLGIQDQHVQGVKLATSGTILWMLSRSEWSATRFIIYRPEEGQWATLSIPGLAASTLVTAPTQDGSPLGSPLRSAYLFTTKDSATASFGQLGAPTAYPIELISKIFSLGLDRELVKVRYVEPLYYSGGTQESMTVTLEAAPNLALSGSTTQVLTENRELGFFTADMAGRAFQLTITLNAPDKLESFSGVFITFEPLGLV